MPRSRAQTAWIHLRPVLELPTLRLAVTVGLVGLVNEAPLSKLLAVVDPIPVAVPLLTVANLELEAPDAPRTVLALSVLSPRLGAGATPTRLLAAPGPTPFAVVIPTVDDDEKPEPRIGAAVACCPTLTVSIAASPPSEAVADARRF